MFAALAEFEQELITERTRAGFAAVRAWGRPKERPRKMDITTLQMASNATENNKSVDNDIAKRLGINTTILYAYVNGDGSFKEAGTKLLKAYSK